MKPYTSHILKMSYGQRVVMNLCEATGKMRCAWDEPPPNTPPHDELVKLIRAEYEPWRNEILTAWAERNNKRVMIVSM